MPSPRNMEDIRVQEGNVKLTSTPEGYKATISREVEIANMLTSRLRSEKKKPDGSSSQEEEIYFNHKDKSTNKAKASVRINGVEQVA